MSNVKHRAQQNTSAAVVYVRPACRAEHEPLDRSNLQLKCVYLWRFCVKFKHQTQTMSNAWHTHTPTPGAKHGTQANTSTNAEDSKVERSTQKHTTFNLQPIFVHTLNTICKRKLEISEGTKHETRNTKQNHERQFTIIKYQTHTRTYERRTTRSKHTTHDFLFCWMFCFRF